MPVAATYPGVYVEEVSSGVHTIVGVTTAVTAFIDGFQRGALNEAVQIFNWGDFVREYGGFDTQSESSYAIWQFYQNGGGEAWIVRCAPAAGQGTAAVIAMQDTGGGAALTLTAASPGIWGNALQAQVDAVSATVFNLTISEVASDGTIISQEVFRNLTAAAGPLNVADVVNAGSQLVTASGVGTNPPAATGTLSGPLTNPFSLPAQAGRSITVQIGTTTTPVALVDTAVASLADVRDLLQSRIRAANPTLPAWSGVTVDIVNASSATPQLRLLTGTAAANTTLVVTATGTDSTAADLALTTAAFVNVQDYTNSTTAAAAQAAGTAGVATGTPDAPGLVAALDQLKDVDFNLLSVPITFTLSETDASTVISAATTYCEDRGAFYVVDVPGSIVTVPKIKDWMDNNSTLRSRNSAVYWPSLQIPDSLSGSGLRLAGPSGTMTGIYARTDSQRGVWKAPAGTDATLRGAQALSYQLSDAENGTLNPVAINALRTFPVYGSIAWGARTTRGADALADDYKYIPPRRLALYIEASLARGLKWAVFEPNDEPLWGQIRLNVGAFMHDLFRQGAFQGQSPRDAYLVKCDSETTTQTDINLGVVNIVVGFAPLKPAEFVIIQIQQLAGQIST